MGSMKNIDIAIQDYFEQTYNKPVQQLDKNSFLYAEYWILRDNINKWLHDKTVELLPTSIDILQQAGVLRKRKEQDE